MKYCTICMKKVENEKKELCKSCNKKREVTKIILTLSNEIDFKEPLSKKTLLNIGITDKIRINHYLWSLNECNIIHKEKNYYIWDNENNIIKFIEKYNVDIIDDVKNNLNIKKSNAPKCERCGKEIKNTQKKTKYCKECKKINKTLKNINKLEEIAQTRNSYTLDSLINATGIEQWKIEGIIWDLQENDLVKLNESEEYEFLVDNIKKFKEKNQSPNIDDKITSKTNEIVKENNVEINIKDEIKTNKTPEITEINEELEENDIEEISKNNKISRYQRHINKIIPHSRLSENTDNNKETTPITTKIKKETEENIKDYLDNEEDIKNEPITRIKKHIYKINQDIYESNEKINKESTIIKTEHPNETTKHENVMKNNIDDKSNEDITIIDLNDENNLIEITTKIQEYIKNYIEVLDRSVKNTDITSDDIFINFNSFLNENYNLEIMDNELFVKYFSTELFKIYPNAYRSFTKNKLNEEVIQYNITVKYKNDVKSDDNVNENYRETISPELNLNSNNITEKNIDKNQSIDQTKQIIREFIENNLIILEREPVTTDLSFHEIYDNFNLYCQLNNYNVNQSTFSKMFKEFKEEYGIKRIFFLGKIRYNVEFKKDAEPVPPLIDIKLRPIDKISGKERENHIQKSLENRIQSNEEHDNNTSKINIDTISKSIPPKIFAATYDEQSLIFIKTRIKPDNFDKLLDLINKTNEKINNLSIHKLYDNYLDVSLEYIVEKDEKNQFVQIIQKYSWD